MNIVEDTRIVVAVICFCDLMVGDLFSLVESDEPRVVAMKSDECSSIDLSGEDSGYVYHPTDTEECIQVYYELKEISK